MELAALETAHAHGAAQRHARKHGGAATRHVSWHSGGSGGALPRKTKPRPHRPSEPAKIGGDRNAHAAEQPAASPVAAAASPPPAAASALPPSPPPAPPSPPASPPAALAADATALSSRVLARPVPTNRSAIAVQESALTVEIEPHMADAAAEDEMPPSPAWPLPAPRVWETPAELLHRHPQCCWLLDGPFKERELERHFRRYRKDAMGSRLQSALLLTTTFAWIIYGLLRLGVEVPGFYWLRLSVNGHYQPVDAAASTCSGHCPTCPTGGSEGAANT